ncbi:MAG: hypothetical protein LBM71_04680 [Elusimicrobiota bacterium]|jgi:t-SNARE complex subunit (syntaxin)|nr:hypothetical protein [Elusimicrobiota bacterium]
MPTTLIIFSVFFAACFILLFFFIAKYRAAEAADNGEGEAINLLDEVSAAANYAAQDAKRIFGKNAVGAKEIVDIKDKLKELHYRIEEIKLLEEKRSGELEKLVSSLEQRVSTFENEYVNKLQPTLFSLISELENIQNKSKN